MKLVIFHDGDVGLIYREKNKIAEPRGPQHYVWQHYIFGNEEERVLFKEN